MNSADQVVDREAPARNPDDLSDAELLRLFVEQYDKSAMTAIVGRHGRLVMGLCRKMLKNEQDAADAFQATFLVLLKKARSIGKPASLASWLHGVACRVALRARSQSSRRQKRERSETHMAPTAPSVEPADEENVGLIHQELCKLPERFRLPLILCCLEGESREEAARQLGWTVGSLKGRLERGREILRLRLARQGLVLSTAALTGVLAQQALAQVPVALVDSTVDVVLLIATGQSLVASAVSTQTAVLTQGVLKAMLLAKMKFAGFVLFVGAIAASGSAIAVRNMLVAGPGNHAALVEVALTAGNVNQAESAHISPGRDTTSENDAQKANDDDQQTARIDADDKLDPDEARAERTKNLKRLGLAMHLYMDDQGAFPPAAIYAGNKPLLSWRVLLLPYIDQKPLYEQFKLDEPWDSAHNKALLRKMPDVYAACGLRRKYPDATFYQVFTGKGTMFEDGQKLKIEDIMDGTSNTAMIVEGGAAVPWTKPVDLSFVANKPLPELGGMSRDAFHVVFADGSAHFIRKDFEDADLRPIITASGQDIVDMERLSP